jgi:hypothetical protein
MLCDSSLGATSRPGLHYPWVLILKRTFIPSHRVRTPAAEEEASLRWVWGLNGTVCSVRKLTLLLGIPSGGGGGEGRERGRWGDEEGEGGKEEEDHL